MLHHWRANRLYTVIHQLEESGGKVPSAVESAMAMENALDDYWDEQHQLWKEGNTHATKREMEAQLRLEKELREAGAFSEVEIQMAMLVAAAERDGRQARPTNRLADSHALYEAFKHDDEDAGPHMLARLVD